MRSLPRAAAALAAALAVIALAAGCSSSEPAPAAPSPSAPVASSDVGDTEAVAKELVGLSESDAVARAEDAGKTTRVIQRDGEDFPATMDYRTDRINLLIEDGKVTKATVG